MIDATILDRMLSLSALKVVTAEIVAELEDVGFIITNCFAGGACCMPLCEVSISALQQA